PPPLAFATEGNGGRWARFISGREGHVKDDWRNLMGGVGAGTRQRGRQGWVALRHAFGGAGHEAERHAPMPEPGTTPITAPLAEMQTGVDVPLQIPRRRVRKARAPGEFSSGSFTNAAGTRAYKLYVPSGPFVQPLPLVVMLHGCKQDPEDFAAGTRMNELADAGRWLVLYPGQDRNVNALGCWNWFQEADQQRGRGEPSIIADMTRHVIATQ